MMNTEIEEQARQTIDTVMAKLTPTRIKDHFDDPIAKAAGQFEWEADPPISHGVLHAIVSGFMEHIYDKALHRSGMLTDPLSEAIFLLENHYHSTAYGAGYTAAVLDADDATQGGVQTVLAALAELVKDVERQKYVRGVLAWHILGACWELRCEIARVLLDRYRPFIPERLFNLSPAQWTEQIPSLMCSYIFTSCMLEQMSLGGSMPNRVGLPPGPP